MSKTELIPDQGFQLPTPDFDKLGKLDNMLAKHDTYMKKKLVSQTNEVLIEALNRTYNTYDLIIEELKKQFSELKIDVYGTIINKIFNAHKTLFSILLKQMSSHSVEKDKLLRDLELAQGGNYQTTGEDQPQQGGGGDQSMSGSMEQSQQQGAKKPRGGRGAGGMRGNIGMQGAPKSYQEKGTDTGMDRQEAQSGNIVAEKFAELDMLKKEAEEGNSELEEALKNRINLNFDQDQDAQKQLKGVIKDMNRNKKKADQFANDNLDILNREKNGLADIDGIGQSMEDQLKALQNAKAGQIKADIDQKRLNEKHKAMVSQLQQTDKDPNYVELERCRKEINNLKARISERDTQIKQLKVQCEVHKEMAEKKDNDCHGFKKTITSLEHQIRDLKDKMSKQTIPEEDKKKIKKVIEENISIKLKLKEIMEELKNLQKENNQQIEKFKKLINSMDLTPEQKAKLLGQLDEMRIDVDAKFNLKEMEKLSQIDANMFRDKMFKDIMPDNVSIIKNLKQEAKKKKEKFKAQGYDADFDPDLLEDGQKIITRKTKVKRIDSKGNEYWEEIEEEVLVDKNGKVIKVREKPKGPGPHMSNDIDAFMKANGGMAIGGKGYGVKPGAPKAKNGQVIELGKQFVDEDGRKVIKRINSKGEEQYEIEEEYIDEYGNKKTRKMIKTMRKDSKGNVYEETEFIDPVTGQKMKQQRKVFKDADGNEVIEETIIGADGKKVTKTTKVLYDKDGNKIIEETIIGADGKKQVIRKRVIKDEFGNDVTITEVVNEDGSITITKEIIGKDGKKIIIVESVDKFGNKTIVQKEIKIGKDGKPYVEETMLDEKGNVIGKKKVRKQIGADGVEETVEEFTDAFGRKVKKTTKTVKDKDGRDVLVEETVDEHGNKITKKTKKYIDASGNEVTEEEIIGADGKRKIIKRTIGKDGRIIEEIIDPETGEKIIREVFTDASGKTYVKETRIGKDGKVTVTNKVITRDKDGNEVIRETYIDPKTGKEVTIEKIIKRDKFGNEYTEEKQIDADGNVINIKTTTRVDKDGNKVTVKEIIGADGKKKIVETKEYYDASGNKIVEERVVNADGTVTVTKRIVDKDGKIREITETIGKDGKKIITEKIVNADGTVDIITRDEHGNIINQRKGKMDADGNIVEDENVNEELISMQMEALLIQLGFSQKKAQLIVQAIMGYYKKGGRFVLDGDELNAAESKAEERERKRREAEERKKKQDDERRKKAEGRAGGKKKHLDADDSDDDLDVLDDGNMNEAEQLEALYERMKKSGADNADLQRQIRNQLGLSGEDPIDLEHFKDYFNKFKQVHFKCGDNCIHLRRFYMKLNFIQSKYKRKYLKMKESKVTPFTKNNKTIDELNKAGFPPIDK